MKRFDFMAAIKTITDEYAANRNRDQIMWSGMTHQARVEKLNEIGLHGSAAEKAASFEQLTYIPEPFFTKLMNNLC